MATITTKVTIKDGAGNILAQHLVGEGEFLIGRAPDNLIAINTQYVSRHHAKLYQGREGLELEDLRSTAGTYVNGMRVHGRVAVSVSDKIQIGDMFLELGGGGTGFTSAGSRVEAGMKLGGGRFELVRELGTGGLSVVWLAQDLNLSAPVAIKLMAPQVTQTPEMLAALQREVLRTRQIGHPNIIHVHEFWQLEGGQPFITLEYVKGTNLEQVRKAAARGFLTWDKIKNYMIQLCDGLEHAHRLHIAHRDVNPSKLMIDEAGNLRLMDFGIAAVMSETWKTTMLLHNVSGTLNYMSPQQIRNEPPRATDDIYSVGTTIFQLMTGQTPFHDGDIMEQALKEKPETVSERRKKLGLPGDVPGYVDTLVARCQEKDPRNRPQRAYLVAEWIRMVGKSSQLKTGNPWDWGASDEPAPAAGPKATAAPKRPEERPVAEKAGAPKEGRSGKPAAAKAKPAPAKSVEGDTGKKSTVPLKTGIPDPNPEEGGISTKLYAAAAVCLLLIVGQWIWSHWAGEDNPVIGQAKKKTDTNALGKVEGRADFSRIEKRDGKGGVLGSGTEFLEGNTGQWFVKGSQEVFSGLLVDFHTNEVKAYEGELVKGMPEGVHRAWGANGRKLMQGIYVDGNRHGVWKEWHMNGMEKLEGEYASGLREGMWKGWHPNGRERIFGRYVKGKREGEWQSLHANGTKQMTWNCRGGELVGAVKTWYADGQRESEGVYNVGNRVQWREWDPSGQQRILANWNMDGSPKVGAGAAKALGRSVVWTVGTGQRPIDQAYLGYPVTMLRVAFGPPDVEQPTAWTYRGLQIHDLRNNKRFQSATFRLRDGKVIDVALE
ncbi:MAG: hypothetical protein CMO66_06285 [Verrucomicrobiales bacterium]|nr:hypothetical protein [Verrucomicrobiales bacterium]